MDAERKPETSRRLVQRESRANLGYDSVRGSIRSLAALVPKAPGHAGSPCSPEDSPAVSPPPSCPLHQKRRNGLPWRLSGKESACQCGRHRFDSWAGKIPRAPVQLSPWPTATAPVLWSLGPPTPGARVPRARAFNKSSPRSENLVSTTGVEPPPAAAGRPSQQQRPSVAQNKQINKVM